MRNAQMNELFELKTAEVCLEKAAGGAVAAAETTVKDGEHSITLRAIYETDVTSYLSHLKDVDTSPSSPAPSDPGSRSSLLELLRRVQRCLFEALADRCPAPPIEVAFKVSALIYAHVFPIREKFSKQVFKKLKCFINDVFTAVSSMLAETGLLLMKTRTQTSESKESYRSVVMSAAAIQIGVQLEFLRFLHILRD